MFKMVPRLGGVTNAPLSDSKNAPGSAMAVILQKIRCQPGIRMIVPLFRKLGVAMPLWQRRFSGMSWCAFRLLCKGDGNRQEPFAIGVPQCALLGSGIANNLTTTSCFPGTSSKYPPPRNALDHPVPDTAAIAAAEGQVFGAWPA